MSRDDQLRQHEARLAVLRRSLDMLRSGELRLARFDGVETTAEVAETVRRELATLEATIGRLRGEVGAVTGRAGALGMTPAVAFALAC